MKSLLITLFLFLLVPLKSRADFSAYAALGTALQFPGSVRVGGSDWEGGLLTTAAIGVDKVFRFKKGTYAAFGPALIIVDPVALGFYGGFGVEYELFWGLTFRGEASAVGGHNGFVRGELNAGLGLHF